MIADATAMESTVTALTTNVTPATILTPLADMLPWVGIMLGVSVGIYFIRRVLKKISRAKAGI